MRDVPSEDLLEVVGCELERRPDAPGISDLEPHLLGVARDADALTVRFAAAALPALEAFVEAERQCCAGLGWAVSRGSEAVLRIEAGPAELDALATMFETSHIENTR